MTIYEYGDKEKKGLLFEIINHWAYKDFYLGVNFVSENFTGLREYYLLISLGFWKVAIGVRL